ncbi:outer membrane protein [Xanthobacter agilis]|uniref:Outer membrane immunogenic protein n=1 Tax=Xanthobacter agilis TaxID=47492 RepID=A0ABU0LEE3_XANAG|nr:outer membrane protein [Xanthobacter agilis]MDQ0505509.1 outer membrane immunogenic protein [Xanthobacter agilis]
MMKRFLLATVAVAALSAPAAAADLATKYPVKAVAAPVFSWTGFYIGANAGYGGDTYNYDLYAVWLPVRSASITSSGWFVGGQLGYNYQFANNVVVGLETDLQWSNISGTLTLGNASMGSSLDYYGTIRARLGYAFDRFLPYITGGAAYGRTSSQVGFGIPSFGTSSTNWGWTIGGGVEYAFTNNWTFKAEYLYVDLGTSDNILPFTVYGLDAENDNKFNTIKAGVNYKF